MLRRSLCLDIARPLQHSQPNIKHSSHRLKIKFNYGNFRNILIVRNVISLNTEKLALNDQTMVTHNLKIRTTTFRFYVKKILP